MNESKRKHLMGPYRSRGNQEVACDWPTLGPILPHGLQEQMGGCGASISGVHTQWEAPPDRREVHRVTKSTADLATSTDCVSRDLGVKGGWREISWRLCCPWRWWSRPVTLPCLLLWHGLVSVFCWSPPRKPLCPFSTRPPDPLQSPLRAPSEDQLSMLWVAAPPQDMLSPHQNKPRGHSQAKCVYLRCAWCIQSPGTHGHCSTSHASLTSGAP